MYIQPSERANHLAHQDEIWGVRLLHVADRKTCNDICRRLVRYAEIAGVAPHLLQQVMDGDTVWLDLDSSLRLFDVFVQDDTFLRTASIGFLDQKERIVVQVGIDSFKQPH